MQIARIIGLNNTSLTRRRYPKIRLGYSWLVVIPAGAWAISTIYIPMLSENLSRPENWAVTGTILLLIGVSVAGHMLAHLFAGQLAHATTPDELPLFIYGDAAQAWPIAGSGWKEAAVAGAGPLVNLVLSGLGYLLWNAQLGIFLNLVAIVLCLFNLWILALNLLPVFPMDGGRLVRAPLLGLVHPTAALTTWIRRAGLLVCLALASWGIFLYLQHSRFSPETAGITFALVLLLLDGLRFKPNLESPTSATSTGSRLQGLRIVTTALLAIIMLAAFASTLMTNNGLEAPGLALSVEPMINVPPQYRHTHKGTFLLLTVFSHAPILAGEWAMAHVDRAMFVLPPEAVVPKNTTIQEQARQGFQQLDESEATAITVGLRLAGFKVDMIGKGAQVESIAPKSYANGKLQVGDVITSLNGQPVRTTDDLIRLVKAQTANIPVELGVQRGQANLALAVGLMPPDASSSTRHIGISIQSAGFDFKPPFPVSIETHKIQGGPSAGLMFTLTLYNALSARDLTNGHKIAGTGTISLDGSVGPIGGVKQKVAAAESTGAQYFLCPVDNYADAVSVAKSIKVIKVANGQDALNFLQNLPSQ